MEEPALKATRVKLSSLVWKIRHFQGQFQCQRHRLQSPFTSSPLFFIATGLPKKIQTNTAQRNKVLQLLIQLLQHNQEHNLQSGSLLARRKCKKTPKNYTTLPKNLKLQTTPPPCYVIRLPQMHTSYQPCVWPAAPHPARPNPPPFKGGTEL